MSLNQVISQVKSWQSQSQKVVLATGVFDLLHIEHIRFLTKAKAAGNKLIVGLESDARVRSIKGHSRPVNSQKIRLEQINALHLVDHAFILPHQFSTQSDWENFMIALKPDLYAVSSHTSYQANKKAICQKLGITFKIVHHHNPHHSTSLLIAKLINPFLTQDHPRFTTPVISGHHRGKDIGYPTLNLKVPPRFPYQHGIYAGLVWLGNQKYQGAFHYGPIPVFHQTKPSLEVYLLNRRQNITRQQIDFQLLHYLRPIKTFPSPQELQAQISQDVQLVQTLLKT